MSDSFQLTLPAAPPYLTLAPDVAARFAELVGGTPADGRAFSAGLADALTGLVAGAPADAEIAMRFRAQSEGLEVELRCGARTATVRQAMAQAR